jgi:hypothetical protein
MMSLSRSSTLAFVLLPALWAIPSAEAADGPSCGKFTVYSEHVDVVHVDKGEDGLSVGDTRHGHIHILDENGNRIGNHYFHTVVSAGGDESAFRMIAQGHMEFPNGTIVVGATFPMPDPALKAAPRHLDVSAVTGGTGEFFGARGAVSWILQDQGPRKVEVDIDCLR